MYNTVILDYVPLWSFCIGTIFTVLLAIEIGFLMGKRRRQSSIDEDKSSISAMVGASLGLLAFMLALTFGMASSRFEERKHLLIEDVNSIRACYLRASLLTDPFKTNIHELLKEYVDIRVKVSENPRKYGKAAIVRTEEILDELWTQTMAAMDEKELSSVMTGLFIPSLNNLMDSHWKRITVVLHNRIPVTIWIVLYFVTFLSMLAMGYYAGLTGKRSLTVAVLLAMTFSSVLILISDLDRPSQGLLRINQDIMIELGKKLDTLSVHSGTSENKGTNAIQGQK